MQTRLVKIVPDNVGWLEKSWNLAKKHPGKAAGVVVATPFLIPLEAVLATGGLLVGGTTALVVGAAKELFFVPEQIEKIESSKASNLLDREGTPVTANRIYARHPNIARSNVVIPSEIFHSSMIAEQIADLVGYIRSVVAARRISISVYSESGAALKAESVVQSGKAGIKGHVGSVRHHSVDLKYDHPIIVPVSTSLFWLRSFPEIEAAFNGARSGRIERNVSVDTTFGLSASLAKVAGIDMSWLGKQRFEIEAEFG